MKAKETVMDYLTAKGVREKVEEEYKEYGFTWAKLCDIVPSGYIEFLEALECEMGKAQAQITGDIAFKAGEDKGTKKVVEYANNFAGIKHHPEWIAQQKEWGITVGGKG